MLQSETLGEPGDVERISTGLSSGLLAPALARREDGATALQRLLSRISDPKKLFRYSATSVLALAISEVTLLLLYADNVVGATSAAFLANLSGTVPSYVLSRYWIWSGADRKRPGRQAAFYWIVSIISMVVSSVATGQISHHTPHQRILHLAVLGGSYLVISLVLWVAKFVVYERTIFRTQANVAELV